VSKGTGRPYPLTMICEVWRVARSTVYAARRRSGTPQPMGPQKRGPKTRVCDEELLVEVAPRWHARREGDVARWDGLTRSYPRQKEQNPRPQKPSRIDYKCFLAPRLPRGNS
jgi:hypothetical protein